MNWHIKHYLGIKQLCMYGIVQNEPFKMQVVIRKTILPADRYNMRNTSGIGGETALKSMFLVVRMKSSAFSASLSPA